MQGCDSDAQLQQLQMDAKLNANKAGLQLLTARSQSFSIVRWPTKISISGISATPSSSSTG